MLISWYEGKHSASRVFDDEEEEIDIMNHRYVACFLIVYYVVCVFIIFSSFIPIIICEVIWKGAIFVGVATDCVCL